MTPLEMARDSVLYDGSSLSSAAMRFNEDPEDLRRYVEALRDCGTPFPTRECRECGTEYVFALSTSTVDALRCSAECDKRWVARRDAGKTEEEPVESILDRLREALVDSAGLDNLLDPEPLIGEDILFRDSLIWMVGKPGCKKSFTALDMAGCVGTGEMWQGFPVSQGTVLYLVAEGVRGTKKRVRAWEKAMGKEMTGVQFLPVAVQAKLPAMWDAFVALVKEIKPALIILDTQARVTVGVEENSNTEMGEFVAQAERLRTASGAAVMIVHHIGRNGDTGRGATTLDGAMSTIVKVTSEDDRVKLECQKNKDGAEWDDILLRAVPMGESIILMPDDGRPRPAGDLRAMKWIQDWFRVHQYEAVSVSVLTKSGVVPESTFHRAKRDLLDQGLAVKEGTGNATRYRLTCDPSAL